MDDSRKPNGLSIETRLAALGRDGVDGHGFVNPAVYHGSTVLFPDVATLKSRNQRYTYGRRESPTIEALEGALAELEGAAGAMLTPSGLAAVTLALLAFAESGGHALIVDSVYQPTRAFCDGMLKRLGMAIDYYDPQVAPSALADSFRPETRLLLMEAPGSVTFEMQDVPALAALARSRGVVSMIDNTWASPLYFRPLAHGVDVSIQAGTKYLSGHSDVLIGVVAANERAFPKIKAAHGALGLCVGPDDIFLALRGLRTMAVRLARHQDSALKVARWLAGRAEVARVLHPGLEGDPGHALWRRDFLGASGLFGIVLKPASEVAVAAFLDGLDLFGLGYSWGGFESLAIPVEPNAWRTAAPFAAEGPLVRLHIGLEDPDDLIADLARGFERLARADGED